MDLYVLFVQMRPVRLSRLAGVAALRPRLPARDQGILLRQVRLHHKQDHVPQQAQKGQYRDKFRSYGHWKESNVFCFASLSISNEHIIRLPEVGGLLEMRTGVLSLYFTYRLTTSIFWVIFRPTVCHTL